MVGPLIFKRGRNQLQHKGTDGTIHRQGMGEAKHLIPLHLLFSSREMERSDSALVRQARRIPSDSSCGCSRLRSVSVRGDGVPLRILILHLPHLPFPPQGAWREKGVCRER